MRSSTDGAMELPLAILSGSAFDVLLTLKKRGEARAEEIAETVGVTPSAVRQHLSSLRAEGLVTYREIRSGPGRPKFAYRLTELAETLFPKAYHELTNELLEHLEEEDPEMLVRIFERRRLRRVDAVLVRLADKPFHDKVRELIKILNEDGYLADFEVRPDGTYFISERNCAILEVASRYPLACSTELEFLREAVPEAEIERVSHKMAGGYVCAYEVRPRRRKRTSGSKQRGCVHLGSG